MFTFGRYVCVWHVIILLCLFSLKINAFQPGEISPTFIRLKHFDINNGLPGETVRCIFQDQEGYLWMGIESVGLCRYNGNQFDIFGHNTDDSNSLSSDFVEVIEEDLNGNLWVGTDFGLNKINIGLLSLSQGKRFTRFFHDGALPGSLSGNTVYSILRDSKGKLWIGTDGGLDRLNDDGTSFTSFTFRINNIKTNRIQVNAIYEDKKGCIWVGSNNGLFLLSPERKILSHWDKSSSRLNNDDINAICEDNTGRIWLGTQSGINVYEPISNTFNHLKFNSRASYMFFAGINRIRKTNDNKLWIGSFSSGIIIYDLVNNMYQYLNSEDNNPEGILSNQVRNFYEDRNGTVWISVKNKGLYTYDKRIETFEYITEMPEKGLGLSDKQVLSIFEDKQGFIWIGTRFGGLNKYDPVKKKFTYYQSNPQDPDGIATNRIESILEDREGFLWLATVDGLYKYERTQNRFTHYEFVPIKVVQEDSFGNLWLGTKEGIFSFDKHDNSYIPFPKTNPSHPVDKSINAMIIDSYGKIWAGTHNFGLMEINPKNGSVHWYYSNGKTGSLGNNMVRAIFEDAEKRLWIGSKQEGFDLFDRNTKKFKKYNTKDGLPSNAVFSITNDKQGNLWLATNNGLSKFDPESGIFTNFSNEYGLQGDIFISGAVCKTKDGKLYFGGDNGLNSFYPEHIQKTIFPSPIVITGIKRNENYILPENIKGTTLKFAYDDYISLEFALLNFDVLQENKYAYRLNGLNNDWVYSGSHNYVSYINLPAGNYSFEVRKAHNDVLEGQAAIIRFEVQPPWWFSWKAIIIYILLSIGLIYLVYKFIRFRANKEHELEVLKLEKEQSEKLSQFKIHFFTNISHEIRTPLTLILPSVEKINTLKDLPDEAVKQLSILKKNTKRLLNLVDELLEFRKLEQGQMGLKCIRTDIITFILEITSMFKEAVSLKNIDFLIDSEHQHFETLFDPGAIEKILSNLLSNAYKFTDENGRIELTIRTVFKDDYKIQKTDKLNTNGLEFIEIKVMDNGIGIPKHLLNNIFNRFYRIETEDMLQYNGIGIGLDLTKNMVALHHGYIMAESTENDGSTFVVGIPVDDQFYKNDELLNTPLKPEKYILGFNSLLMNKISPTQSTVLTSVPKSKKENSVLIVEDDLQILEMLHNIFSEEYHVLVANDGETALKLTQKSIPDLVLSDVMMPGLNGHELCRKIKSEIKTSHIPVILVSANAAIDHKIEGFESGADSYVTKPFHIKQLEVEIKNLISSRQRLKELFRKNINIEPGELNIPSLDEKFISRCMEITEKYLAESSFGVTELSREIGLSRTQLFRKLKALIGQTPLEFIYSTRLKTAAKLLTEKHYPISDVAYMTGFSNPASFSTSFRRFFGQSPSVFTVDYSKNKKRNDKNATSENDFET